MKRLPNGYGSVVFLGNNRSKPYGIRKTAGYDQDGTQKYVYVDFYGTRQDALQALAEFNDNPYDLELSKVTFADIYEKWSKDKFDEDTNRSTRIQTFLSYKP